MPEFNLQQDSPIVTLHIPVVAFGILVDAMHIYKGLAENRERPWGLYEENLFNRIMEIEGEVGPFAGE